MRKLFGPSLAFAAVMLLVTGSLLPAIAEAQPALGAGSKALAFTARTTDGQSVNFPAGFKGRFVLLDFWATWCAPCREEVPHIVAAYNRFHAKGFDILGVSLDYENDGEKLARFTQEHHIPWPQIYEGKEFASEVALKYNIDAIPHAFLVDGDTGKIVAEGDQIRGENLATAIEKALAARASK